MNSAKLQDTRSTQKSVVFPYASNEQSEKEIKKTISIVTPSKRIEYLGINLTREVQEWILQNIAQRN